MIRLSALLLLTAAPLAAQDIYGSASLSFGTSDMAGAPVAIQGTDPSLQTTRGALTFGTVLNNGTYLQGDFGLTQTNNANTAPNTYNSSNSLVLHAGRTTDRFDYGLFLGAVQSDHDNDASDDALRLMAGLEGGMNINDRLSLNGHLGYLTGTNGSDSVATVTNGLLAGIGLEYAASDRLTLGSSFGYVNGKMDAPSTVIEAWTLELRADYGITAVPGLSVFAAAQYGEYHQKENIGPDDITNVTSIMAGLSYRFGKSNTPKTANLGYVEPFLANTGGVLE